MSTRETINPSWRTKDMSKVNHGKRFEKDFKDSLPERVDFTRLKDAGGWGNATNLRFSSTNPCDMIIYSGGSHGRMYKLELKSTQLKSLPFGNIKDHQLDSLCKSEVKGVNALFIVNFRAVNETYRVSAWALMEYIEMADRKSIPLAWFRERAILIKQTLKRTRYRYNLEWL